MANELEFPARGKITAVNGNVVTFAPVGTNYQLQLQMESPYTGALNVPVEGEILVEARKVWTVPSGGNFIVPIFGPPKIVQGRVRQLSEERLTVHAGTSFVVGLPESDTAFDLSSGPVTVGRMVNVTLLPGARFTLLSKVEAS
jgi:hypothetical protein